MPDSDSRKLDALFHEAVNAIDVGDVATVDHLLRAKPHLATSRLTTAGDWLRAKVGGSLDGFFRDPYLLWFVAEDPVRNGKLPANIATVAQTIIDAARRTDASELKAQLDYALMLVAWSWIARECGVQIALLDVILDAGASPMGGANNALVNRNTDAARHLVARGDQLSLGAAATLQLWDELPALAASANESMKRMALVLTALNGEGEGVRRLLALGADPNASSGDLYPHGTPLHHAVSAGSLDAVRAMVDGGADVRRTDTAWGGTPRGWAHHYIEQHGAGSEAAAPYVIIAEYLKRAES